MTDADVPHKAQSEPGMDVKMTAVGEPMGPWYEDRDFPEIKTEGEWLAVVENADQRRRLIEVHNAALDRAEKAEKQKEWANAELVRERSKRMVEAANLEQERDQLAAQNAELRGALKAAINEAETMKDAGFGVGARDSWLAALSLTPQAALAEVEARALDARREALANVNSLLWEFADDADQCLKIIGEHLGESMHALEREAARIRGGGG